MKFSVNNLIKAGYFFEEIPSTLFTTKKFSEILTPVKIEELIALTTFFKFSTPCSRISIYKNEMERRLLNFMHIEKYFVLSHKIAQLEIGIGIRNWTQIFA